MVKTVTIDTLHKIAKEWNPSHTWVNTIDQAADNINRPHEDYPEFVSTTKNAIKTTIMWLKEGSLKERDIRSIHQLCMDGNYKIVLGEWRKNLVTIQNEKDGDVIPAEPHEIPMMMMSILPVEANMDEKEIVNWYKLFETIHPFSDGNGRVGGTIMAALSFLKYGKYLVNKIWNK